MKAGCLRNFHRCECYGTYYCNCKRKSKEMANFVDDLRDVASTISKVMTICGMNVLKAAAAVEVIVEIFMTYDEVRTRIDSVPRKRLRKEYLLHALGRKCQMNRMESQLSYSIIKRAFRAFYYGTGEGGVRHSAYDKQLKHTDECLWVHAAKRTAHVLAIYEGMFHSAQKKFESKLMCVYKKLYDRLQRRMLAEVHERCECEGCMKRLTDRKVAIPKETSSLQVTKSTHSIHSIHSTHSLHSEKSTVSVLSMHDLQATPIADPMSHISDTDSDEDVLLPREKKCNCPALVCDPEIEHEEVFFSAECGQGPYICRWVQDYDDDDSAPFEPQIPEPLVCPVDEINGFPCARDCECTCQGDCVCSYSDIFGYDESVEEEEISGELDSDFETNSFEESIYYDVIQLYDRKADIRFSGCRVVPDDPKTLEKMRKRKMAKQAGLSSESEGSLTSEYISHRTSKSSKTSGSFSITKSTKASEPPKASVNVLTKDLIKTMDADSTTPGTTPTPEANQKSQTPNPLSNASRESSTENQVRLQNTPSSTTIPSLEANRNRTTPAKLNSQLVNQQKSKGQPPRNQPQQVPSPKSELTKEEREEIKNIVGGLI